MLNYNRMQIGNTGGNYIVVAVPYEHECDRDTWVVASDDMLCLYNENPLEAAEWPEEFIGWMLTNDDHFGMSAQNFGCWDAAAKSLIAVYDLVVGGHTPNLAALSCAAIHHKSSQSSIA